MKAIYFKQNEILELEEYAKYRTQEVFKKEILEDDSLKEYIVFGGTNNEDAFFIVLFKNNTKKCEAVSGRIYTCCENLGDVPHIASFGICFNGTDYPDFTFYNKDLKAFTSISYLFFFTSSKKTEQIEQINKTIDEFMKKLKEMLYKYYNIEK